MMTFIFLKAMHLVDLHGFFFRDTYEYEKNISQFFNCSAAYFFIGATNKVCSFLSAKKFIRGCQK